MTNFGALMMSHQGYKVTIIDDSTWPHSTVWWMMLHIIPVGVFNIMAKSDLTNKQKLLSVDFLVTSVFRYHILLATFTVWLHHIKFQLVQARNASSRNQDPPQPSETESSLVDILSSSSSDHKSSQRSFSKKDPISFFWQFSDLASGQLVGPTKLGGEPLVVLAH